VLQKGLPLRRLRRTLAVQTLLPLAPGLFGMMDGVSVRQIQQKAETQQFWAEGVNSHNDPCMVYLPTFGSSLIPNVGKYTSPMDGMGLFKLFNIFEG